MTINECYIFCQFIFNKYQNGYITPSQFNNLAPIMQMALINDRLGNVKKYRPHDPVPPYGYGLGQKAIEELRPLYELPAPIAVASGQATIPTDMLYLDSMSNHSTGYIMQQASRDEIFILNKSVIKPPTANYPYFVPNDTYWDIFPTSLTFVRVKYVRRPATPVWGYNIVNDEPVYDAGTSQDFETSDMTHLEICWRILQAIGVSLSLLEITQYAEQSEIAGK